MRADVPVILDANVLAEAALGDLFLRLSEEPRLVVPKWTKEIWGEVNRTMISKLRWPADLAEQWCRCAQDAFPEAMVTDYEPFLPECANDQKDRHILAAAIRSNSETIVTMNVKHFRAEHLERWGVTAIHPDEYLMVRYEHKAAVVVNVINAMAKKRKKPMPQMLARIGAPAPRFAAQVGSDLQIEVPHYDPAAYRQAREE